jgi:hypothetical protein
LVRKVLDDGSGLLGVYAWARDAEIPQGPRRRVTRPEAVDSAERDIYLLGEYISPGKAAHCATRVEWRVWVVRRYGDVDECAFVVELGCADY